MSVNTSGFNITDGTRFIVLDLEWNQPYPGKDYGIDVASLRGEIIDIGAEKYVYSAGTLIYEGKFSVQVRPKIYRVLHFHVRKLTHKTNREIKQGLPFEEVYPDFQNFCGDDYILVCWGNSDPDILKQNLKFLGMNDQLDTPFLDLQPVFSRFAGERGQQRSVEFAVDYYNIPKDDTFHSAWADSHYTGLVFKEMFEHIKTPELLAVVSSSLRNPDISKDFTFVSGECESLDAAYNVAFDFPQKCPLCNISLNSEMKPFRIRKSVYAMYNCREHGDFFCRTRVKKTKSNKYFAAMVMRFATQSDYYLIADKAQEFKKYGVQGQPKVKNEENEEVKNEM